MTLRCLSSIETRYSKCGLCLVGYLNRLQITRLRNNYNLKQIVNFPTWGERTLDLVLTNLQDHYESPTQRPPLGLSDHMSIEVQPKVRIKSNSCTTTIQSRDMRPSKRLAMRTYLESVDLDTILNSADSCEDKTSLLEQIIKTGLDHVMPIRTRKVRTFNRTTLNNIILEELATKAVKCLIAWWRPNVSWVEKSRQSSERCAAQIITKPRWNIRRNVSHLSGGKRWKSLVGAHLPPRRKVTLWNRYNICMRLLTKPA